MKTRENPRPKPRPKRRLEGRRLQTVRQVLDWFKTIDGSTSAKAIRERSRVRCIFAKKHSASNVSKLIGADLVDFVHAHCPHETHTNWTRRRWIATIRAPFHVAEQLGLIETNPFARVPMPKGSRGRDLTDEEFRSMLRVAAPAFRRVLIFLRFTGARPGEMRALEWTHIQKQMRFILQRQHKTSYATCKPRKIRLNRVAFRLLEWIRARSKTPWVFSNTRGKRWSLRALGGQMERIRRRAGLPDDVKLYGCRHAFATGAIAKGIDISILAQLMGHSSIRTTEIYIHLADKDDVLSAAAEKASGLNIGRS